MGKRLLWTQRYGHRRSHFSDSCIVELTFGIFQLEVCVEGPTVYNPTYECLQWQW